MNASWRRILLLAQLVFPIALSACSEAHGGSVATPAGRAGNSAQRAGAGGSEQRAGSGGSAAVAPGKPTNTPSCKVTEKVTPLSAVVLVQLDLLFVIDDSSSMAGPQARLRDALPRLLTELTTGDRDGDGRADFPPASSLHLGVVTTDMGLPGVDGIANCTGLGGDGLLQTKSTGALSSCEASYDPFVAFNAGINDPMHTAEGLQCLSTVGTNGCGFADSLEAPLKALWPSVDPMATNGQNRLLFLADPRSGSGRLGHGDVENADFLRNDPSKGLSLIAVVVLSDKDDCSASDTRPFTPQQFLDPSDPLSAEPLDLRCHFNQNALYPLERYELGLQALRPGNEQLVFFTAIAGVPADLTDVLSHNFADESARSAFYSEILSDPRMQETIDTHATPQTDDDVLTPSCRDASGLRTEPPIRLVKVAQAFGANGLVQSICQDDYGPALDAMVEMISHRLGGACLPPPLFRSAAGTVDCEVTWELPSLVAVGPGTPVSCDARPWLRTPGSGKPRSNDRGGQNCSVVQLPVMFDPSDHVPHVVVADSDQGWYYDDFSDDVRRECAGTRNGAKIAFTPDVTPPAGVQVTIDCISKRAMVAQARTDVLSNVTQPEYGSDCEPGGDAACAIQLIKPSKKWPDGVDHSMICHPVWGICVSACASDADCAPDFICDSSRATLLSTARDGAPNGTPICLNPSCPIDGG